METNPAEDDLIAQVHQELMDNGEPDSNPMNLETLDDESYGNEENENDLDIDVDLDIISNNSDSLCEIPLEIADDCPVFV